jgi:hypothetical protein
VTEQAILDVLGLKRLPQERVVAQVDHPYGKVVAGAPIRVDQFYLPGRKSSGHAESFAA